MVPDSRPRLTSQLGRLVPRLLDLVFAPICLGCRGPIHHTANVRLICRECRLRLRPIPEPRCTRCDAPLLRTGRLPEPNCSECRTWPPSLRAARSAHLLAPPADQLVYQLKYRGWRALARPIAESMAELELPLDTEEEARFVVPVPTTKTRERERGYNQAAEIAAKVAEIEGLRLVPDLERSTASTTQTAMETATGRANVASAFRIAERVRLPRAGHYRMLVDVVFTTGGTAWECVEVLVEAGV